MMKADTTAPRVLMIDDQSMAEDMIRHMLSDRPDISLNYSPQADNAVNLALAVRPTVVLVDLRMPTVDGLAVTRSLRGHAETRCSRQRACLDVIKHFRLGSAAGRWKSASEQACKISRWQGFGK